MTIKSNSDFDLNLQFSYKMNPYIINIVVALSYIMLVSFNQDNAMIYGSILSIFLVIFNIYTLNKTTKKKKRKKQAKPLYDVADEYDYSYDISSFGEGY